MWKMPPPGGVAFLLRSQNYFSFCGALFGVSTFAVCVFLGLPLVHPYCTLCARWLSCIGNVDRYTTSRARVRVPSDSDPCTRRIDTGAPYSPPHRLAVPVVSNWATLGSNRSPCIGLLVYLAVCTFGVFGLLTAYPRNIHYLLILRPHLLPEIASLITMFLITNMPPHTVRAFFRSFLHYSPPHTYYSILLITISD